MRKEDVHQSSVGFNEPLAQKLPFKEVYLKILAKHPNKLCKIPKNSTIDSFSSALSDPTVLKTFNEPFPLNKFKDTWKFVIPDLSGINLAFRKRTKILILALSCGL